MRQPSQLLLLIFTALLWSCSNDESTGGKYSFYHWKSKAKATSGIEDALDKTKPNTLYLHYFDVDVVAKEEYGDGIYPVSVLTEVDDKFKDYQIIPVIFITNKVMKSDVYIDGLANKIKRLISQIHKEHFGIEKPTTIQLDCDWTETSKEAYFKLIELLKQDFVVGTTIRLHQIKYQEKTGIPPVNRGTLMLYNVGDLSNQNQNSILESKIVEDYIDGDTKYPIPLSVALPLFSQTVVNNNGDIRLITGVDRTSLTDDKTHFEQVNEYLFKVKSPLLYKGLYLFEGCTVKLEETSENEVLASYKIIQDSDIELTGTLFYHLDDATLNSIDFNKLINKL